MTIEGLLPNQSGIDNAGSYTATGAASLEAATADGNDATYIQGTNTGTVTLGFTSYTLASDERCLRARVMIRLYSEDSPELGNVNLGNFSDGDWTAWTGFLAGSIGWFTGDWFNQWPGGGEWTQTNINKVQSQAYSSINSGDTWRITDWRVELDIRHQATCTVTGPSGSQDTRRPTVTWTRTIGDSQNQTKFQVRIKDASDDSIVWNSGEVSGDGTSRTVGTDLPDDTYYAEVRVAKSFNGADWWSEWDAGSNFTISDPPGTPTNVRPQAGATVTRNRPTLRATLVEADLGSTQKARWELATNAGFSTNVRTVTEPNADLRVKGETTEVVPVGSELFQGVWYIRARQVDSSGEVGPWTSGHSFTVAHIPAATNLSPRGGQVVTFGDGTIAFGWQFTDPDPEDVQTAYKIEIERDADALVIADTGKLAGDDDLVGIVISDTYKDVLLRWRVTLWDGDDVAGTSPWQTFTLTDGPEVQILNPAQDAVVGTPQPHVTWTFTASPLGGTQSHYRIVFSDPDTGDVAYDSGWRVGEDTGFTPDDPVLDNTTEYALTVYVRESTGEDVVASFESFDTITFSTLWDVPIAVADVTVDDSNYESDGYISVMWSNDVQDSSFDHWEVYRREVGQTDDDWVLVGSVTDASDNLLADENSSLENSVDEEDWVPVSASCTLDVALLGLFGDQSLEITAVSGDSIAENVYVPVTATLEYRGHAWFRGGAGSSARDAWVRIDWYTATPTFISSSTGSTVTDEIGEWVEAEVIANAPGTATQAKLVLVIDGPSAAEIHLADLMFIGRTGDLEFKDYTAGTDTAWEWSVVQVVSRFNALIPSDFSDPASLTPSSTHYWLADNATDAPKVKLELVTSEVFEEEYEQVVMNLIGRGRKVDRGTRLGYRGSLTCKILERETVTAREQRLALESAKADETELYLRNPFGDTFLICIERLSFDREAGVGTREHGTVTIDYVEVS